MKKLTGLFILLVLMVSCKQSEEPADGNNFYFQTPQPINDSELSKIPNKFLGYYVGSDSIKLNILEKMIIKESYYKFRFHKNQIDSLKEYFNVVDGKYISKDTKEIFNSKKIGDSIEFYSKKMDTIFNFSDNQKAKRINGNLILSKKKSMYWNVKLISLNKNNLIIKQLYSDDDLKRMDSITKIHSKKLDSIHCIIYPSRREFAKFLELKNFGYDTKYLKMIKWKHSKKL